MDVQKIILLAVALIICAGIVAAVMVVYNMGQNALKSGQQTLTDQLAELSASKYDTYDGMSLDGNSVVQLINSTFDDTEIEAVVCTKDGNNLVYNTTLFDTTGYIISSGADGTAGTDDDEALSNKPTYDALHKTFAEDGGNASPLRPATGLMIATGYDITVPVNTPGYIASAATFNVSVQKNTNGIVRRITFIQQ